MAVRKKILEDGTVHVEQTTYYGYESNEDLENDKWNVTSSKPIDNQFKTPEELEKENLMLKELYSMICEEHPELRLNPVEEALDKFKKLNNRLNING